MADQTPHYLIVDARFYEDYADELYRGAIAEFDKVGATYSRISVPGVLEIPAAISMALAASEEGGTIYEGFVALGVVIRGETTHYDIVCNESARALMDLAIDACIALGNGIQTVENVAQANARVNVNEKNKGGGAAIAALEMAALRRNFKLVGSSE